MYRLFTRAIRAGVRSEKIRNNDVPVVVGEEVKRKQDTNERCAYPRNSTTECLSITAGLVVSWDLYHRFCRPATQSQESNDGNSSTEAKTECPLNVFRRPKALAQPVRELFGNCVISTASYINPRRPASKTASKPINIGDQTRGNGGTALVLKGSIDRSPFLQESLLLSEDEPCFSESDDDSLVCFEEFVPEKPVEKGKTRQLSRPSDPEVATLAEKIAGNLLNLVGGLQHVLQVENPPMSAYELLKKSEELGSARAMYNLGVMNWEKKDFEEAEECFKSAADRGHPLACYNYAVMMFNKEKTLTPEIKTLMSHAYMHGVSEAKLYV